MPSRLSAIFSRSEKATEAKADEAANEYSGQSSDPVPQYSVSQPPPEYLEDGNDVPPPDYTAGFANLSLSDAPTSDIPDVNETIAHLKVLESFYVLKQSISSMDGLFGIDNARILDLARSSSLENNEKADDLLPKLAEKRWAVYVARAVDRFNAWMSAFAPVESLPNMAELVRDGTAGLIVEPHYVKQSLPPIERANLPPIDVLMVWHAYMLNPRAYLEDCIRLGRMALWNVRMPWNAIAACINASTFKLEAGAATEGDFTRLTGRYWDNLVDDDVKKVKCPNCQTISTVPWTTCGNFEPEVEGTPHTLGENVDAMLGSGMGYCDRDLSTICMKCETRITHNVLRAGRFREDVEQLLTSSTPMPGTILGLRGIPFKVDIYTDPHWKGVFTRVNALLSRGLGQKILDQPNLCGEGLNQSMARIRDTIGETITDNRKYMKAVRDSASGRLTRLERVGFRKMMGRYWENSSPFSIDLVGAVIRQGGFVEKMHNIDWLHSPALPATMARLILKYERFVKLMSQPDQMAVPTLDVDLAWHTHQLNPPSYFKYSLHNTRQFIDHDDKVATTKLDTAFAWTSKTYEKTYGDKYSECTCWYCEAIRESNTSSATRIFSMKGKEKLHDVEQDPKKSVHISAHNAVNPSDDPEYTNSVTAHAAKLEAVYQKACERAKKKRQQST
ncbi:hypothetical protein Q7P37_005167 [Cladosporium fusiforme]